MAERSERMRKVLDRMVDRFGLAILESKEPFQLVKRSGINMNKEELKTILEQLKEKAAGRVKEEIDQLVVDNEIDRKFVELEELINEGEELNKKLGLERGYLNFQPNIDVAFHLSKQFEPLIEQMDEEIGDLEEELSKVEKETSEKSAEYAELVKKVQLQQERLEKESKN